MAQVANANPVKTTKKKRTKVAKSKVTKVAKKAKRGKVAKTKRTTAPKVPNPPDGKCRCGCGRETKRYFAPGHDARFHGWLIKEAKEAGSSDMPAKVAKQYKWKKTGEGRVPTTKYDGTKYAA